MTASLKTIIVEPDSELGSLIKDAATTGDSVIVNTGEAVYVLDVSTDATDAEPDPNGRRPSPEQVARSIEGIRKAAGSWNNIDAAPGIWEGYDPERARESILAASGSWQGIVDAEAFKAYIRERRRTKNRPSVRW